MNIASRLEAIAPAGGICISQSVHDMVKGKLEFQAVSGGARTLKNIAVPISVWLLHPRGEGTDGTIVNERAPPGRIGEVNGIRMTMISTSQWTMPLVFGMLSASTGMLPLFLIVGGGILSGSWFAKRKLTNS